MKAALDGAAKGSRKGTRAAFLKGAGAVAALCSVMSMPGKSAAQTPPSAQLAPPTEIQQRVVTASTEAQQFVAENQAAIAKNLEGVACTLRTRDGRTQFLQGELIRVSVGFASDKVGAYRLSRFFQRRLSLREFGAFHVSPRHGANDPLNGLPRPSMMTFHGYIPDPVVLTQKPYEFTLDLNEWLRFDRPGTYQVYVTSARIYAATDKKRSFFEQGSMPIASNLLTLEILPADAEWAKAELQTALTKVDHPEPGFPQTQAELGLSRLRYLGTREAARAIIERMGRDKRPRASSFGVWEYQQGLIGFADRTWLVREMIAKLAERDYPITQPFLDTLSLLTAAQRTHLAPNIPVLPGKTMKELWLKTAASVGSKTDIARAMTLHSLLELAWLDMRVSKSPEARARVPQLAAQLVPIFDQLPPLPQQYLLDDQWKHVRRPAMLAPLRRLRAKTSRAENSETRELSRLITRRIHELAPVQRRPA